MPTRMLLAPEKRPVAITEHDDATAKAWLPTMIPVDPALGTPLYRQISETLRRAILDGRIPRGRRLPSTRQLAIDLHVSRNTVLTALDQLRAEGYIVGRTGAGTFVVASLPEHALDRFGSAATGRSGANPIDRSDAATAPPARLSRGGQRFAALPIDWSASSGWPAPFRPGLPALDAFPYDIWRRIAGRNWHDPPRDLMTYGDPNGYEPLRRVVSEYLGSARGVRCEPDQVLIVGGASQAIDLAVRVLTDPGDTAWIEEPGFIGARTALLAAGVRVEGAPVDDEGLDIERAARTLPGARLVYVTPSCQLPLGATMSASRRLALLEWALREESWIVEDDYDSEFRYDARPLQSLQGLDRWERVIYIGTFSKVLFPGLRLAYLVVPRHVLRAFSAARVVSGLHVPTMDQAVLAEFMEQGHFSRHLRRMRLLYAERQGILLESAREHLRGEIEIEAARAGMQLVAWLPPDIDDRAVAARGREHDLELVPLSSFYLSTPARGGLVLGYSGFRPAVLRAGVERLARLLRDFRSESAR
jgi:GntR family transcriptional regulator/MocR family aminotransferase